MNSANEKNVFIQGELVYLRKPIIEKDVINGDWHQWFNDYEITKYLVHGVYPNDKETQVKIVEDQLKNKSSLILSIVDNKSDEMVGVISLKSIDLINRNAEIGIVMGFQKIPGGAVEAMALLTQHAFDRLNLIKLYAGQHEDLWKWVNTLECIGYKIEGVRRNAGIRNGKIYDVVLTGITKEDYYDLKTKYGGKLFDSIESIFPRKRRENLIPDLKAYIAKITTNNS
jgi:RimJ/RimL family protein N-acetyltransferase